MLTDIQLSELLQLRNLHGAEKARTNLFDFGLMLYDDFSDNWFHKKYYAVLDKFAKGIIKKLIVTVPPQHGKSSGSSELLPAYLLGINPKLKIAIASYAATKAEEFNRSVQRIIDSEDYKLIFPGTTLSDKRNINVTNNYLRNQRVFEIVGKKGSLKAIGRGGGLTGDKVDIVILDDLYKDAMEANSPIVRQSVIDFYISVIRKRLHNNSQELIVFTRWHEEDLIGVLEKIETIITLTDDTDIENIPYGAWLKINYEAIKTTGPTKTDPRQIGEALWEEMHSIRKLTLEKRLDPIAFECLNQGNPSTPEGRLYSEFKVYSELPKNLSEVKNYTDTADKGNDYLCSIFYQYHKITNKLYIKDIYYTQKPQEITENELCLLFIKNNCKFAKIESNAGGRAFARNLERLLITHNYNKCVIKQFHQSKNKESRIVTNSAQINRDVIFPENWSVLFPKFFDNITFFKRLFKANKHDDAPDTLTGVIEMEQTKANIKLVDFNI